MARTVTIEDFVSDLPKDLRLYGLGLTALKVETVTAEEEQAIRMAFEDGMKLIEKISPKLADEIRHQFPLVIKLAEIAKADMDGKPITYPSVPGKLGVAWLIPQVVKYVATPNDTNPAFTDYTANSWYMDVTAGTEAYILGGSGATEFYKPSPTEDQRAEFLIFKNGLVQIGTRPVFNQMKILTETRSEYGVWTTYPVADVQVENNKPIYIYNTPFAIPVLQNTGLKFSAMPVASGRIDLRLMGVMIYEHELLKNLKYVS